MPKLRQESDFPLFFLKGGQYWRQFSQRDKLHKEQGRPDIHTATQQTLTWNSTASVRIPVSFSPSKTCRAFTFQTWKGKQQHQIQRLARTQTTDPMGDPAPLSGKKALQLSIRFTSRTAPQTAWCYKPKQKKWYNKENFTLRVKSAEVHQLVLGLKLNNVKNAFKASSQHSSGLQARAKN